jgi:cellobiose phosphorylase
LDTVIPAQWKGFTVTHKFRGNTYDIDTKNPKGNQRVVKSMLVDGEVISGNLLPV